MNHQHGIHVITVHEAPDNKKYGISDEEGEKFDFVVDRQNHSRMLTLTTTQGYDDWWFLTTRRQQLSPKDFPGRPGGEYIFSNSLILNRNFHEYYLNVNKEKKLVLRGQSC